MSQRSRGRAWRSGAPSAALALIVALQTSAKEPAKAVDRSGRPQVGAGSFYGPQEAGKPTASGAPLQPEKLTAASPTLPLGTHAKVTNTDTGKAVTVTINDRGPYSHARIVDVTPKAAEVLGMTRSGVASVEVKPLSEPPPPPPAPK